MNKRLYAAVLINLVGGLVIGVTLWSTFGDSTIDSLGKDSPRVLFALLGSMVVGFLAGLIASAQLSSQGPAQAFLEGLRKVLSRRDSDRHDGPVRHAA